MAQDNASIIRRQHDCFNRRDFDTLAQLCDADCKVEDIPSGEVSRGPAGFTRYARGWVAAFPDARAEVTNLVASGDHVVCEFRARGTNTGPLQTRGGTLPPTGKPLDLRFCEVLQLREGRIINQRVYYDVNSMLQKLGLVEEEEGGAGI
jgi:steroid delta-isomerase-like uncharacterized protein